LFIHYCVFDECVRIYLLKSLSGDALLGLLILFSNLHTAAQPIVQSAVPAQPMVLQQASATPTVANRNIIVQTLPVASVANSAGTNVIQLGQLSVGGATVTRASSLSQVGNPATSGQTTSSEQGMLIQIGGQTYRMQGVQQVQVGLCSLKYYAWFLRSGKVGEF